MTKIFKLTALFVLGFCILGFAGCSIIEIFSPPGSYQSESTDNVEVVKAAKFAVDKISEEKKTKLKFVTVKKAQMQVVAGFNYQILIQTTLPKGDGQKDFCLDVTVYQNPQQEYSVTSWKSVGCPWF